MLDPAGRRAVEVRALASQIGVAVLVQGAAAGENRHCGRGFEVQIKLRDFTPRLIQWLEFSLIPSRVSKHFRLGTLYLLVQNKFVDPATCSA